MAVHITTTGGNAPSHANEGIKKGDPLYHSLGLRYLRHYRTFCAAQAMLDQRDFTGKAALHHAVADMEERHRVVQALLAAKAQVKHAFTA